MLVHKCPYMFYKFKSECLIAKKLVVVDKLVTIENLVNKVINMVNIAEC